MNRFGMMELQCREVARVAAFGTAPTLYFQEVQLLEDSAPPLRPVGLVVVVGIAVLARSAAILLLPASQGGAADGAATVLN
jgi:hypothetical protein